MSLHYYNRLEQGNIQSAIELKNNTFDALTPFFQYIDTAIKSLKNKEAIQGGWSIVATDKIQLKLISNVYRIEHKTKIKVKQESDWYLTKNFPDTPDFSEEMRIKEIKRKYKISQTEIRKVDDSTFIQILEIKFPDNKKSLKVDWGFDEFEIFPNEFSMEAIESITYNGRELEFELDGDSIFILEKLSLNQKISINEKPIQYEIISNLEDHNLINKSKVLKETRTEKIILSEKIIPEMSSLSINELKGVFQIHIESLTFENTKNKFAFTHFDDLNNFLFSVDKPEEYKEKVLNSEKGIRFQCVLIKPDTKDKFLIQLKELENSNDDDPYSKSPLDYFFDEDVSVKDDQGNEYEIGYRNFEEKQISLKQKGKDVLPNPSSKYLRVKVSTYQLQKQKEAIFNIQNKPVREQRNLIKLFEPRNQVNWNNSTLECSNTLKWYVLKEEDRAGCNEQRDFISKALSTEDFSILEGPPGSGKTTVILELICQIIERNQRVLLCGSTHVAIDNVLERLKAKGLMDELSILAIRIGRENVISDEIKEYSLENQIDVQGISERLLYESANLVCGTTIGILQYPEFKEQKEEASPIVPDFDYLIIDESSKTTFQEFLVPAFYAKKWILVGDINQLAPFTDRDQFISNLRSLDLGKDRNTNKSKILSMSLQRACYILYLIQQFSMTKNYQELKKNKLAFVLDSFSISELKKEVLERIKNKKNLLNTIPFHYYNYGSKLPDLCEADIVIIDSRDIESSLKALPEYFIVIGYPNWLQTSHYFKHRQIQKKGTYQYEVFHKGKTIHSSEKVHSMIEDQMKERDWAEELTWRLIRDFELRNKERDYLFRKELEDLYPQSEQSVRNRIQTLRNVALPSILEGIQKGIKGKFNQEETTLTKGFYPSELKQRHTKLKYQHRMHSTIAQYPSKVFYNDQALLTHESINQKRNWDYNAYNKRSIWLDVNGKTFGNKNLEEVKVIMKELDKFIGWVKNQTHPDPIDKDGKWKVAVLSFYKGQEKLLRERLQSYCNQPNKHSQFMKDGVKVFLYTVDKFQGQEADIVFLSMVQTNRDGFLDNPNRLNVAITRARFQLVIIGFHDYFLNKSKSDELNGLAKNTHKEVSR